MADLAGGAARRRRELRLRSWLRHERMTVRMELAAALHHSAGPDTNDAARSQKTVSSRGVRPGVLQDPAPQLVSEHAACPCSSGVPSHSLPALADAAGDAVDSTTLRFLTAAALKLRQMEEEEEEEERKLVELEVKRKESELQSLAEATRVMAQQRATGSSSWTSALARSVQLRRELKELRGEKRKKRKKRKKRSFRRLPQVMGVPVFIIDEFQQSIPQFQFIHRRLVFHVRRRDRYPQCIRSCSLCSSWTRFVTCGSSFDSAENCGYSAVAVHRRPSSFLRSAEADPTVQTVQQTTEIPLMPFVFRWSMPLLCRFCASQVVYLRTQRTAWFDSGYMRCVSLREFHFLRVWWIVVLQVDSRPALFQRLLGSTVNTSLCVSLRGWSSWSQCTSRCILSLSSGP